MKLGSLGNEMSTKDPSFQPGTTNLLLCLQATSGTPSLTRGHWLSGGSRDGGAWGIDLSFGARLADHVIGDQVAVEDVPSGGDEATAVADTWKHRKLPDCWSVEH